MNSNKKSVLSLVLVGFMLTNFSGCASKSEVSPNNSQDECGKGTTAQGGVAGAIIGGLLGALTGGNKRAIALGTGIGAVGGTIAGHFLSEMQCKYHGQERELIKQINTSRENQEKLSKDSDNLSKKITALSNEMKNLDIRKNLSKSKKEKLLSSINHKTKNIITLQKQNSSSRSRITNYTASVNTYKYKDNDKKALKKSLNEINSKQKKIEIACVDNLKKLKELKRRITL